MRDKILFLGASDSLLLQWLRSIGETVVRAEEPITTEYCEQNAVTFIVSYGYRHIIGKDLLDRFPHSAVNLHISYLPWNRGADPNLWSFIDGTPKGVTIHYLDSGIDTGDIIAQKAVAFGETDTLATSYAKLHALIQRLFRREWPSIKAGTCGRVKQSGGGSFHLSTDKGRLFALLPKGWDTPISSVALEDSNRGIYVV